MLNPPSFDVHNPHHPIHQHHLLEASAGTGKTYSIENLVARLLLEPHPKMEKPLELQHILIVTFTKAAVRDLKQRIRSNFVKLLEENTLPWIPSNSQAKEILEEALFNFDKAQIFTIHSFCHRMLQNYLFEGGIYLPESSCEESLNPSFVLQVIHDFLLTGVSPDRYTKDQLISLVESHSGSQEKLEKALLKAITNRVPIAVSDENFLFERLAADCQHYLNKILAEEEIMGPDDILLAMQQAVTKPGFSKKIGAQYPAVIIDEFQDTDPIQWKIFQTLFLTESHLYLVGDPKQSIYSFRQADIYTYLAAAKALGPQAKATLDTNYRSELRLIQALNTLFTNTPDLIELPRLQQSILCSPLKAGQKTQPYPFQDSFGAIHFFEIPFKGRFSNERVDEKCLTFLAPEICRLIEVEKFSPNNIAILVKDYLQADRIIKGLKEWNIPALFQRNGYLSQSPAIHHLYELLTAVLNPRDESSLKIALGGPVISWTHNQILGLEDLDFYARLVFQFIQLREKLFKENFQLFFQVLMRTQFGNDSLSSEEKLLKRQEGIEIYQDLQQLAEILTIYQSQTKTSPEGLLKYLDELTFQDEGGIKKRIDSGQEAVQILTLHSSKGLEFPVVFIVGLYLPSQRAENMIYDETLSRRYPVLESDSRYELHAAEYDAEKMRQLYVAFTRAKHRTYVGIVEGDQKGGKRFSRSPMEIFLQKLNRPLETLLCKEITHSRVPEISIPKPLVVNSQPILMPPKKIEISTKRICMYSYSSLAKSAPRDEQLLEPPHDFFEENKNVHTLPSGSEIGNILHHILEVIPFQIELPSLTSLVKSTVEKTEFESWQKVIVEILQKTLQIPLPVPLPRLDIKKIYRETEFLFPWDSSVNLPEMERQSGFIKGVIDLVFQHEGLYYLVDWKSNWLGPDDSFYEKPFLEKAMKENGYLLQAHVYKEALQRYLSIIDPKPFASIFGGMYYVFLRGGGVYKI